MTPESDNSLAKVVNDWVLMSSPAPLILIFVTYLIIVVGVGPNYMKGRKPMNLNNFIRVYNIAQVVVCTYFLARLHQWGFSFKTIWQCLTDERDFECKSIEWWFLILRLVELTETVIFVLRKKQNQVSALHVYHHIATASLIWIFLKYTKSKWKVVPKKY